MSKLDRRNQAKQKLKEKNKSNLDAVKIFSGANGAPRHVAVVPLSRSINTHEAIKAMNESLDITTPAFERTCSTRIDRFKQNLTFIPTTMDYFQATDAARIADFVVFVLPVNDDELNEESQALVRAIEGQGISNTLACAQGMESVVPKKRADVLATLKSYMIFFFPAFDKVLSLDSRQDCANLIRGVCTSTPKGIHWREDRSWMLMNNLEWLNPSQPQSAVSDIVVSGVVRGKGLKADRLVHIPGWGDFQIATIVADPLSSQRKTRPGQDTAMSDTDQPQILDQPSPDADDLAPVAPDDVVMDDDEDMAGPTLKEQKGVLIDDRYDHFDEEDDDDEESFPAKGPRRVPKGTSSYQAAWYLEDVSDSDASIVGEDEDSEDSEDEEDDEDEDMELDEPAQPGDGEELEHRMAMTDAGASEYPQSEMFVDRPDDQEAEELEQYRKSKKSEADEDLEFPDEIELHPNVIARERLARYRGLTSLRTSHWETSADRPHEPEDWRRLLHIQDYKGSRNRCLREALAGGVAPGTRVKVHIRDVPLALRERGGHPICLFSLLRHEHKHSVVNINMTLNSSCEQPLKAKEEIIVQYGPRRLIVNPVFSNLGNTPNNVHKLERFLHPGRSTIASFIGPICWGLIPVLVFRRKSQSIEGTDAMADIDDDNKIELIGRGSTMAPDHSRVVAKRVVLTGHPFKIHRRVVTVRYMFFNTEDVNWFKALRLWTKRGRTGFIKESLGTHGYFKASFDQKINPQDSVAISLYKRVFPRKAKEFSAVEI